MSKLIKQYFKAAKIFNPHNLIQHAFSAVDNIKVVDRNYYIKNEQDEELFCTILHNDYLWDYSTPLEQTSIYYSLSDEGIVGGAYDMITKRPMSRTVIIPKPDEKFYKYLTPVYIYNSGIWEELIKILNEKEEKAIDFRF